MMLCHVIISGATGGIGCHIAKLAIKSDVINKCTLLYRNEKKYQYYFAEYADCHKIEKVMVDMEKSPEKELSLLSASDDIAEIKLILAASTIEPIERITLLKPEQVIKNININIISQINLISSIVRNAIKMNLKVGIINLNSGAAYRPLSGWSLYSGSKSYLNIFLKTLVKENPDINIVSYDPGVVDTSMQKIIRSTSINIFDEVETFKNYKLQSQLNDPQVIAQDIFHRYVLEWKANYFEEKYCK